MPAVLPNNSLSVSDIPDYKWENTPIVQESDDPVFVISFMVSSNPSHSVVVEEFDDGSFAAYFEQESGMSSSGNSLQDALESLFVDARSELKLLKSYKEKLARHLKKRKIFLESLFHES